MKKAKHTPHTTASREPTHASTIASPSTATPAVQPQKNLLPIGFYDDALADAKARHVDVHQVAKKQLETEWEAFQEFAAEVEKQSIKEEKGHVDETNEREAVEQLEQMQYVDRYRMVLERVTCVRNGEKRKADDDVDTDDDDSSAAEMTVNEYKKKHKKLKKKQQQQQLVGQGLDDLDPCNWRSRGMS